MSNDLISRSALLKEINGDENKKADALMREWYADMVRRQPAAYDVDKVVERLRKEISDCMCEMCDRHTDCDTCRAEKAVEIAKSGGIE